jgi:SnoaL-like protein
MDTAALVDRMVDSYNRHDTDALAACYGPHARVHQAGWPEAVDAQTWLALFGGPLLTTFPDLQLRPRNLAADDRVALLETRLTGTNTGPFPPTPPSGWCSAPRPRRCQRPDAPSTSAAQSCSRPPAAGSPASGILAADRHPHAA